MQQRLLALALDLECSEMMVKKNAKEWFSKRKASNGKGGKWNENRMKRLDFINKRPREKNEARAYIKNVDEAMLEYYRVFAKK